MNDQQLIELVQGSPIEDFTLEQIQQLRARIADSPELRAALNDRLRMDHHLVDALGASGDSPDQFVQKILRRQEGRRSRSRWSLGLGALAIGLLVAGTAAFLPFSGGQRNELVQNQPVVSPNTVEELPSEETVAEPPAPPAAEEPIAIQEATENAPSPVDVVEVELAPEQPPEPIAETPVAEGLPLAAVQPITFAHLTALPDADRFDSLNKSQFDAWFTRASPKLPADVEEFRDNDRPQVRLRGWFRLKGTLPPNTALRFELSNLDQMRFHFYAGDQGVSVVKYRHDYNPWYAYAMQRGEDGVQPRGLTLLANDGYREHRSNARNYDPITIYFDDASSELVIYRGDVEAIRVPLPQAPEEIYFAGESIVRRMNLWPLTERPPPQRPDYPAQVTSDKPAELPWQERLAKNARLEKNADGSVTFVTDQPQDNSWACVPLPGFGPRMIDLELSEVDRSFGVFLTAYDKPAEEGGPREIPPPRDGVVFGRDRRTDQRFARFSYIFDGNMESDHDVWEHPTTLVGDRVWLRLLQGGGQVKGWISQDGIHWALLSSEANNAKQYYDHLGIAAARVEGQHRLTINKIVVRPLPLLTEMFPEDHWRKIDQIPWSALDSRRRNDEYILPSGATVAADVATQLRRLTGKGLSFEELTELSEKALQGQSPQRQKQILAELLTLTQTWPLGHQEKRFLAWSHQRLDEIFIAQLYAPDRQPEDAYRRELFNLPTINRDPVEHLSTERLNAEVLAAIQQQRWADILFSCETILRYYRYDRNRAARDFPILHWAGGIAVRHAGRVVESQDYLTEGRSSSMLVEDLSKEAYNISADLNAALESGAIEDACRLITQIPETAAEGLAPSASDPDHFFSVPAAIQMAAENHRQLRQQMQSEHSDLAQVRLNAAIQRGDRRVIQLVTLQFFDTSAAAQAHLWLGDQATAAGNFATSLQHYLKAARSAAPALQAEVDARILMLGHEPPDRRDAPTGEIALGSADISAESLVAETSVLRESSSLGDPESNPSQASSGTPAWPNEAWQETDIRWDAAWGNEANALPTAIRETKTDWRGGDIGVTVSEDEAYACNRFELIKLDLQQHKLLWKTAERDQSRGKANDYPLTKSIPLLVGDLVLCRMLHEKGFALYAVDRQSGEIRWESNLDGQVVLATDPIVVQGRVLLVTLKELSQATYAVRLSHVDLATGEMIEHNPLFRIRDTWFDRGIGNIVQHQERLLIDLGGVVAACDISGYLQWVRKQLTFPQAIDNRWAAQQKSDLVISGDRAVAFHAGSMRMECVDLATGYLHWTIPAVNIQSVRLVDEQTLLVERPTSWQLVGLQDGEPTSTEIPKPERMLHWLSTGSELIAMKWDEPQEKELPPRLLAVRVPLDGAPPIELQSIDFARDKLPGVCPSFYGADRWYFWFHDDAESDQRRLLVTP